MSHSSRDVGFFRRYQKDREIYRPGSGPLKKSPADDKNGVDESDVPATGAPRKDVESKPSNVEEKFSKITESSYGMCDIQSGNKAFGPREYHRGRNTHRQMDRNRGYMEKKEMPSRFQRRYLEDNGNYSMEDSSWGNGGRFPINSRDKQYNSYPRRSSKDHREGKCDDGYGKHLTEDRESFQDRQKRTFSESEAKNLEPVREEDKMETAMPSHKSTISLEGLNWAEEVELEESMNTPDVGIKSQFTFREEARQSVSPVRMNKVGNDGKNICRKPSHGEDRNYGHSRNNSTSSGPLSWRERSPAREEKIQRNRTEEQQEIEQKIEAKMNNIVLSERSLRAGIIRIPPRECVNSENCSNASSSPPIFPQAFGNCKGTSQKRHLYNPTDPKKPIVISTCNKSSRSIPITPVVPPQNWAPEKIYRNPMEFPPYTEDHMGQHIHQVHLANPMVPQGKPPAWYNVYSESFRISGNPHLLLDIKKADEEISLQLSVGAILSNWKHVNHKREFLRDALKRLLVSELKFCQLENVETHMWKILYYNIVEILRPHLGRDGRIRDLYNHILEEGMSYFRDILRTLQEKYQVNFEDYIRLGGENKPSGFAGLAKNAAQKVYVFLGDLHRYKESTKEAPNYHVSRLWYLNASKLNPRNGKPYNQLAILAVVAKRKFDAVFYYTRSLMAANAFQSSRESLLDLFNENRKLYELKEKQRREEKEKLAKEKAREKESVLNGSMLRREIWIRPEDGRKIQRTTSTSDRRDKESDVEHGNLDKNEVYKRFFLSFLHVHGKLFAKVGMETLQEAALEMLKDFKMLLSFSPCPLADCKLLQVLAINMFAIDKSQLKDVQLESFYRSAVQESAVVISLQMCHLIFSRCAQLIRRQMAEEAAGKETAGHLLLCQDALALLPAMNVWCDWLFNNTQIWNPPPSCADYAVRGCGGDCWKSFAAFVNILEEFDVEGRLRKIGIENPIIPADECVGEIKGESVPVNLTEYEYLRGLKCLAVHVEDTPHARKNANMELCQICARIRSIKLFVTGYLCGIDPPILKLHKTATGRDEYVSIADNPSMVSESATDRREISNDTTNGESSEEEENVVEGTEDELLRRKQELERLKRKNEKSLKRKQETIEKELSYSVEMEIRPHDLVADTNCWIDYLDEIQKIAALVSAGNQRNLYCLVIPLVVLGELEGLAKGKLKNESVAENAKRALAFVKSQSSSVRCVTKNGKIIPRTAFACEEDGIVGEKNDDKILTTCMNLCKHNVNADLDGRTCKLFRDVVLLTSDRNLRVKALSANMPVLKVTEFAKWAGVG